MEYSQLFLLAFFFHILEAIKPYKMIIFSLLEMLAGFRIYWLYPQLTIRPPPQKKDGVLGMTLNCIWWWGSNSGDLRSVHYPIHCHYSQVHSDLEYMLWSHLGQIDLFKIYSYSFGPYAKKFSRHQTKNVNMNVIF